MSNAGWYPDPSGQPGQFRYWDGSGWSAETAPHASGPPPGSGGHEAPTVFPGQGGGQAPPTNVAPGYPQHPQHPQAPHTPQHPSTPQHPQHGQPPQQPPPPQPGYGGGGYGGYPPGPSGPQQPGGPSWGTPTGGSTGGGSGKTVGIVIGVVVLVIALGVGTFLLVRSLSGDDDDTAGGGETSQTESGTETTEPETPTESTPADPTGLACSGGTPEEGGDPVSGGTLTGGGLSVDQVGGYEPEIMVEDQSYSQNGAFDFADGMATVSRLVTDGWVAGYGVGSLTKDRGYDDPQQAAETAMSCLEQSANYQDVTRRDELEAGEVDVDGASGYSITSDILAEAPDGIPGDRVVITVVDTGDADRFGLYINYVPLGYNDLLRTQTTVTESLGVG